MNTVHFFLEERRTMLFTVELKATKSFKSASSVSFSADRINQTIIGGARTDIIPPSSETYTSQSSE